MSSTVTGRNHKPVKEVIENVASFSLHDAREVSICQHVREREIIPACMRLFFCSHLAICIRQLLQSSGINSII